MDCDFVEQRLSAFLDREESTDSMDAALSQRYGCESCQKFFRSAVRLRSTAGDDNEIYPVELDGVILRRMQDRNKANFMKYRLRLPAYVASAAAVILIVISFAFGFMVNRSISQREIQRALSSRGLYVMPQQTVYPVVSRTYQGERQ